MTDMTPERARKAGRRWSLTTIVLIAVQIPLGMLGFNQFVMPLNLFVMVCAFAAGERHGWADGFKAAEKKFARKEDADADA